MVEASDIIEPARRSSDSKVVGLISAAHFVSHLHILVLPPLFAFIRADYGVSYARLGLVLAAFNIVSAALQTPTGFVVDRLGPRRILIGGLALGSSAILLAALVPTYWMLVAMFAVAGLANTVYHPADYAILSHRVAAKRIGQAFSIHTFSGMLGFAAAPASMLFCAQLWGWHGALVAAAVLGYIVGGVLILNRDDLDGAATAKTEEAAAPTPDRGAGWRLLFSPPIIRNLMFFVLLALASGGITNFSVVALGAIYGTPVSVANIALSGFLLMSALGVLLGGVVADRTRHHNRVAVLGFALSAIVVLLVGTVESGAAALIALMAIGGLLNGVIMPSRDMIVRAVTPPGSFGKVFGFVTTGFNIGGVVSPLIFGWLMDQGSPRAIFLLVVGFTVLSLLTVATPQARQRVAGRAL